MANKFLKKLFGDTSSRELKKIQPIVGKINALAPQYRAMSDEQLQAETPRLRAQLEAGATLDDILPEAFAAIREGATRVLGMTPFDVQVLGGIVLHQGRIAEMKTGEGKTLTSTMPAYLNALAGKGVHIVTVNDYLAKFQGEQMGKLFRFMGLTCGVIVHDLENEERRAAYASDITYGTNNEMGFDYLRDNMAIHQHEMVQRGHFFGIVDEVDSILIDEARTPLIISGQGEKSTALYAEADVFARKLEAKTMVEVNDKEDQDDIEADYLVDEKARTATITPRGAIKAENYFKRGGITEPENAELLHHINQAIKAHGLMKHDIDYVVHGGEIVIVDEFTGRLMFGRRYSEGLHQAIEAKEHVDVQRESKTLATITFQNYFRLYEKLSGMTGTALTEEDEFRHIYRLDVIEVPTNMPMIRDDHEDQVFRTESGKLSAVLRKIEDCHGRKQPILVGTVSIEKSEELAKLLDRRKITHQVLNAKHHEKEAGIIAQAGRSRSVTIATNMAGRGTDIMLGGNPEYMALEDLYKEGYEDEIIVDATGFAESDNAQVLEARAFYHERLAEHKKATQDDKEIVLEAGGLCILGTERHESRRIDNQLRGRAGRQGDPGESTFYLSLEDDLMRLFGSERMISMMEGLGVAEDEPLNHRLLSSVIENAQVKVEGRHFQSRKSVLEYDDVMNHQRELIYGQRMQVLGGGDVQEQVIAMIKAYVAETVDQQSGSEVIDRLHAQQIATAFVNVFVDPLEFTSLVAGLNGTRREAAIDSLTERALKFYAAKEQAWGPVIMRELERVVLLRTVDTYWMDHIDAMQELRQGIGLNAYANVNPVDEYKRQGFDMFEGMIHDVRIETGRRVFLAQPNIQRERVAKETGTSGDGSIERKPVRKKKVGRNDLCPCGSGKKYKKCCGK